MTQDPAILMIDERLAAAAAEHVALVRRLERLADYSAQDGQRLHERRGDRTRLKVGDVALVRGHGRWRYGVVIRTGPADAEVAYLVPSALDSAQRTWISRSTPMLEAGYPARVAAEAASRTTDVAAAAELASQAFKDAVFFQSVAAGCPRRPWATLVPLRYVRRDLPQLFKAVDQRLGEDPPSSPACSPAEMQ